MKNKRWKRKAKRIYGKCLAANGWCSNCEFQGAEGFCNCTKHIYLENIPIYLGIRELEREIKIDNKVVLYG